MTRVAVFSDTHGSLLRLPEALSRCGQAPDAFIHLGDFASDAEQIARSLPVPYYVVRGNCDVRGTYPPTRVETLGGARLLLLHGHQADTTYQIAHMAEEAHCCAVLFGHTHTPLITAFGPVLILNPGSLWRPRGGAKPSFALLDIQNGDVNARLIAL